MYLTERSWPLSTPLAWRHRTTPTQTALIDTETDHRWNFRELAVAAETTSSHLRDKLNLSTDDHGELQGSPRIGYLLDPSPAFVTSLYGAWNLGATAVGLHTASSTTELQAQVSTADVDAVIYGPEYEEAAENLSCRALPAESIREMATDENRDEEWSYDPAAWGQHETALILFTSGTTGTPKGVQLTLENLVTNANGSAFRMGVRHGDRWLCCLPVSHMGGLAPVVRTVLYGTTLVVQREFDTRATERYLYGYDITHISLVPTQLTRLLDDDWRPPSSLHTVLLGGAPAPEALLERCAEFDIPVYPSYGMTETASQIATARPDERLANPGTVGAPLVNTDVTILDEGSPVGIQERGEIVVDGPTVTQGYLDEAESQDAFGEYGFHTGDVGYRDEDGHIWILGRRDDVILTGGELVAPAEVTETLREYDNVDDAAVIGLPDDDWGERVVAVVVPSAGTDISGDALREFCRHRLASYKVPKRIEVESELPRTQSGTVDRATLREMLAAE